MFRVNLKDLLQLAKLEEGPLVRHKRIKCGKWWYLICYALQDGFLNIQHVRRTRNSGRVQRARRRRCRFQLQSFSQTWLHSVSDASSQTSVGQSFVLETQEPRLIDESTQTWVVQQSQAGVDTSDLNQPISRHQQTTVVHMLTTSCQTKRNSLEVRGTQVELRLKARWTQSEPIPIPSSIACTQTLDLVVYRSSHTQTTNSDDVEELLKPHELVFQLILRSLGNHSCLLMRAVEAINQLLDFKHLELQKQRIEAEALQDAQEAARQQKLRNLKAHSSSKLRKRFKFAKLRIEAISGPKQRQQQFQLQEQAQKKLMQTECRGTQTEKEIRDVSFAEAYTQTDRIKVFSWLRHSN